MWEKLFNFFKNKHSHKILSSLLTAFLLVGVFIARKHSSWVSSGIAIALEQSSEKTFWTREPAAFAMFTYPLMNPSLLVPWRLPVPKKPEMVLQAKLSFDAQAFSDVPLTPFLPSLDEKTLKKLSQVARKVGKSQNTKGLCLKGVRTTLERVLLKGKKPKVKKDITVSLPFDKPQAPQKPFNPSRSAENFRRWATHNPRALCETFGLMSLPHQFMTPVEEGMIYVYEKGTCSFNRRHGHIEIVTNRKTKEACSDHCRVMNLMECQPTLILAPVERCEWLYAMSIANSSDKPYWYFNIRI